MKRESSHNDDNILDYLHYFKDIPRSLFEFGEVDYGILSVISYAEFENLEDEDVGKSLKTLLEKLTRKDINELIDEDINVRIVLEKVCKSHRFGSLHFMGFFQKKSDEKEEQYAALLLSSGRKGYLVFRGTDGTVIGWKENAIMLYNDEIPSERHALETLEKISKEYDEVVIMGHSKGGLIASWCGRMCSEETFSKLKGVYSFDGPGLSKALIGGKRWDEFSTLFVELIPKKSIVSVLFETLPNTFVVDCNVDLLNQHYITNWVIDGTKFKRLPSTSTESKLTSLMIKDFLSSSSESERKIFCDTLFSIVDLCNEQNVLKLPEVAFKKLPEILGAMSKIPVEAQKICWEVLTTLRLSFRSGLKKLIHGEDKNA